MDKLKKEMYLLALQFFRECGFKDAQHGLERLTGLVFDETYFMELINQGEWQVLEEYVSGFTSQGNNPELVKIFFSIKRQKYFEALKMGNKDEAGRILENELAGFEWIDEHVMYGLKGLLRSRNLSGTSLMRQWGDVESSREELAQELVGVLSQNPDICDKLEFPKPDGRFGYISVHCLLNQYKVCGHFMEDVMADRLTLLKDHECQATGNTIPALEWCPESSLPLSSVPVSEGLNLELPEPSLVVIENSSHLEALAALSLEPVDEHGLLVETVAEADPHILGDNVNQADPSSVLTPNAVMSASRHVIEAPPPVFDLNCFPEDYLPEDEELDPLPLQLEPVLTEPESSNMPVRKRIRSDK